MAVVDHDPRPGPLPAPRPAGRPARSAPGPARAAVAQAGGMAVLLARALRASVTRPSAWAADFVHEAAIIVTRCSIPLALSVFVFGFGAIGVQAGLVLEALGGTDRTGGVYVTAAVREVAGWVTAMVVAGIAGTAITADLGARKTREELDALEVLAVDPLRGLVVPRMLAMALITPLLFLVAVVFCTLSGFVTVLVLYDTTIASFTATFQANFTAPDLIGGVIKSTGYGIIIAVVCCYKGLHAKGGPEGVGRAVNQAVVIAFAAVWIFNYVFTSVLLAVYPELTGLR